MDQQSEAAQLLPVSTAGSVDREQVRALGRSAVKVTRLAIGCNSFGRSVDGPTVKSIVSAALANGVNFFDAADVYGDPHGRAEELLGEALGRRRNRAVIATKFGFPMFQGPAQGLPSGHGARNYVSASVDASLRRLRTDYIDLFQIHVPDPTTPVEETLSALEALVENGKVRSVGVSRYSARQLTEVAAGSTVISSVQAEYSLLCFEVEEALLPKAESLGVAFLACLPVASGLLTGKYRPMTTAPHGSRLDEPAFADWYQTAPWAKIDAIRQFAQRRSLSMLNVSLGYVLSQPAVTSVITGVTSEAQVVANVHASDWRPDAADVRELRRLVHQWPNFNARIPWERAGKW